MLSRRKEVQKSASVGLLYSGNKQVTVHGKQDETSPETSPTCRRGILKSTSTAAFSKNDNGKTTIEENITINPYSNEIKASLKLLIPPSSQQECLESRDDTKLKIMKAREEFLKPTNTGPSSAPAVSTNNQQFIQYPNNRLSQVSVGSESSCDSSACGGLLVKSASAGMINIDSDVYKQFDPALHQDGYVSLPRSCKKPKEGFLSNITSRFRKVKMRRNKDHKMNTVSTLCRQSLVVDISSDSQEAMPKSSNVSSKDYLSVPSDSNKGSSSEDMSAGSSRTGKWISRSKIFKSKQ